MIRDLLRNATSQQIAKAKEILSGQASTRHAGIALIGLRGAGKSTLGRIVAERLGWAFVELNKEIERRSDLSVAEILALYGQEGFRRKEHEALASLLGRVQPIVLATGGGIVSEHVTFDLILSSFFTVWLRAKPEERMGRVRKQGDQRPMADSRSAMEDLRTILLSREPLYTRANVEVDTGPHRGRCGGRFAGGYRANFKERIIGFAASRCR